MEYISVPVVVAHLDYDGNDDLTGELRGHAPVAPNESSEPGSLREGTITEDSRESQGSLVIRAGWAF